MQIGTQASRGRVRTTREATGEERENRSGSLASGAFSPGAFSPGAFGPRTFAPGTFGSGVPGRLEASPDLGGARGPARSPRRTRSWGAATLLVTVLTAACASVTPTPVETPDYGPSDLLGRVRKVPVSDDDTLIDLARTHDLGYLDIVTANPDVDPWLPGEREVLLPTAFVLPAEPREGIVINLASQRLFLFRKGESPQTFPIGVSRDGWKTPIGRTKVVRKKANPVWYPGPTARKDYADLGSAVPPGPENPLGTHAIYLGWQAILIHGTNEPYGIGRRVSRGCIRLYPEDIVRLFPLVDKGMPVRVENEPIGIGWLEGELYLEAHLTMDQATSFGEDRTLVPVDPPTDLRERVLAVAGGDAARIDWDMVEETVAQRRGIPTRITRPVVEAKAPPSLLEPLRSWFGVERGETDGSADASLVSRP